MIERADEGCVQPNGMVQTLHDDFGGTLNQICQRSRSSLIVVWFSAGHQGPSGAENESASGKLSLHFLNDQTLWQAVP